MDISTGSQFMATPPASPAPANAPIQPKRKWWKILLLIPVFYIVLLVVVYVGAPYVLSALFSGDDALADTSQVTLQSISIPDQDNGYLDLSKLDICTSANSSSCKSVIIWPKDFDHRTYLDFTKAVQWDQAFVDKILQDNQQALAIFDQASRKNYFQITSFADFIAGKTKVGDVRAPSFGSGQGAARLQALKALTLSYQGNNDEALKEAVKIHKVGHNIIAGHDSIIGNLVGIGMQTLGSQTILRILANGTSTKEIVQYIRREIESSSDNVEGYKDALRSEYTFMIRSIDEELSRHVDDELGKFVKHGYYFKPNKTKNVQIDLFTKQVAAVGNRCEIYDLSQEIEKYVEEKPPMPDSWEALFTENYLGKISFWAIPFGSALSRQCQNDLVSRIVQIELALSEYKMNNGTLPPALNTLVPQYLPSVPIDPFVNKPITYNPVSKMLFSPGLPKKYWSGTNDLPTMENQTFQISF